MIRPWNKADDLAREDSDKPDKPDKLDAEGTRLAEEAEMIERACAAHQNPKALKLERSSIMRIQASSCICTMGRDLPGCGGLLSIITSTGGTGP